MASSTPSPSLLDRLRRLLARPNRLDDTTTRSWRAISFCFLIAILLWFSLTMRDTYLVDVEMPVRVVDLPEGQALRSLPPGTISAEIEGTGFELLSIFYERPTIDLSAESNEVNIEQTMPNLLRGARVLNVRPTTLYLRTDERIERHLPIEPRVTFDIPAEYDIVDEVRIAPDSVRIQGAASVIGDLEAWPTERLVLSDVRDSVAVQVPLSDTLNGLVQRDTPATVLFAQVEEFTQAERRLEVRVQGAPSSEDVIALEPEVVTVRYRVPFSQYQRAQRAPDFFATVSYDAIRADQTGRVQVELNPPNGLDIRNVEIIPPTLTHYTILVEDGGSD